MTYDTVMEKTTYTKTLLHVTRPQCVVLDMDSTLSEPVGEKWEDMVNHQPIQPILDLAWTLHKHGYDLVVSTARPESCRAATQEWLQRHLPVYAALYMRSEFVKATAMKEDALGDIDKTWDVAFAIDDSPYNAAIYRDHGVLCLRPMTNEEYWEAHGDH
jgi:hypothetical protein